MNEEEEENGPILIKTAFNCYEIQRTITRYLSTRELKSLRLVDINWMEIALISLKEKSFVNLDSRSTFQNYFTFLQSASTLTFSPPCFTNYKLTFKPDKFQNCLEVTSTFHQFWMHCREFVKELQVALPWTCVHSVLSTIFYPEDKKGVHLNLEALFLSIEDVRDGNDWSMAMETDDNSNTEPAPITACPVVSLNNLISLGLNVSIVLNSEKKVFPFTWKHFFTVCPNVCHLSIQSDYASGHFCRIINTLADREMGLKTLKIGTRDQRLFSDEFQKRLFSVTTNETVTLSLGFLPSIRHDTPLNFILWKAADSLRHLTLLQYRSSNQTSIGCFTAADVVVFPRLTCLRINKELLLHLNFLSRMKKLRRLEIYRDSTVDQHDGLGNPVIRTRSLPMVLTNLQSLVLEMFVPPEDVWKLVRWFPNLNRLQMKATDVIARVIFSSCWKDTIQQLFLTGEVEFDNNNLLRSKLTDEGITGLSKTQLSQLFGNIENPDGGTLQAFVGQRDVAYIGNLTKLHTLKLQVIPDYQTGLTDFSVHFGIRDLPCLSHLTLVKTLVSEPAADTLKQRGVSVIISKD